jgi:hypothetical protein
MSNSEARRKPIWWGGAAGLFLILSCVGVALLAKGLYPVDLPAVRNPDFVDIVFHNRAVLWTTRLVLVFGGVFIVVSIGIRMKNGELLKRAGPFEVSENTLGEVEGRIDLWRAAAAVSQEEVAELTERLEESDELIKQFRTVFASGSILGKERS